MSAFFLKEKCPIASRERAKGLDDLDYNSE